LRNAIAFDEIRNSTEFIRNFILDERPIQTESLRSNLATWDEIAARIEKINNKISAARTMRQRYIRYAIHQMDKLQSRFLNAWHLEKAAALDAAEETVRIDALSEEIEGLEGQIAEARARIDAEEAARDRKKDMERSAGYSEGRQILEVRLEAARGQLEGYLREIDSVLKLLTGLRHTSNIDRYVPAYVRNAREAAVRLEDLRTAIAAAGGLSVEPRQLLDLVEDVRRASAAQDALAANHRELHGKRAKLDAEKAQLSRDLAQGASRKQYLDDQTQRYLNLLLAEQIVGHALPTLVEIKPGMEDWVPAVEAVLGAFREAVYVEPQDRERAYQVLRHARSLGEQDLWNVRLIKSDVIADGVGLRPAKDNAVVSVLLTENPIVRKFLDTQFGQIQMVGTLAELKTNPSAIMKDCSQSQGLALRVHRKRPPILGQAAQARLGIEKQDELEDIRRSLGHLEKEISSIDLAQKFLAKLDEVRLADIEGLIARIGDAKAVISELEIERERDIDPDTARLIREIEGHGQEIKRLRAMIDTQLQPRISQKDRERTRSEGLRDHHERERQKHEAVGAACLAEDLGEPYSSFRKAFFDIEEKAVSRRIRSLMETLERMPQTDGEEHRKLANEADKAFDELLQQDTIVERYTRMIGTFLQEYDEDMSIVAKAPEEILLWLVALVFNLEENELRKYEKRVEEFRSETRKQVKELLVMKLHDSLRAAQGELKKLNKRLRQHRFEGSIYLFTWKVDPAMRPLYEMATRVAAEPDKADALLSEGGTPLLDEAVDLIREIFANEGDVSRFEDYRQYFEYEVRMTFDAVTDAQIDIMSADSVSDIRFSGNLTDRLGKGSGGQKQTPYYVAIAASMAAAYYPASRGKDVEGMGLVCFDEAFSKLDINNTQSLLRFFKDLNLQVLVAAPEEKRTSFMELMDTIVNISKVPGEPELFIDVERIGPRAQHELKTANPDRLGIDGYRKRLEESNSGAASSDDVRAAE
jgi:uncharacterized protein YPO0396